MTATVGVKFCGHCDPEFYGPDVLNQVRFLAPDLRFVNWDNSQKDVLLIINACRPDCAARPDFSGPIVQAAGYTVERQLCSPAELPRLIEQYIRKSLNDINKA